MHRAEEGVAPSPIWRSVNHHHRLVAAELGKRRTNCRWGTTACPFWPVPLVVLFTLSATKVLAKVGWQLGWGMQSGWATLRDEAHRASRGTGTEVRRAGLPPRQSVCVAPATRCCCPHPTVLRYLSPPCKATQRARTLTCPPRLPASSPSGSPAPSAPLHLPARRPCCRENVCDRGGSCAGVRNTRQPAQTWYPGEGHDDERRERLPVGRHGGPQSAWTPRPPHLRVPRPSTPRVHATYPTPRTAAARANACWGRDF